MDLMPLSFLLAEYIDQNGFKRLKIEEKLRVR